VADDADGCEPVSTAKFPASRDLAGNFLKKGPRRAILASKPHAASIVYKRIPCLTGQGIFLAEQGILWAKQGICAGPVSVDFPHFSERDLFSPAFLQVRKAACVTARPIGASAWRQGRF
jgi:hypothetical protein